VAVVCGREIGTRFLWGNPWAWDGLLRESRHRLKKNVKVKCTLVQALRLCTGPTAHRGSRGIALLFHDHDTRRE